MSKLRLNMMLSLDGFAAGPEQSEGNPYGIRGMQLNEWLFPLKAFREMHGDEGGEVNASTPIIESWFENIGARPSWGATCSEGARGRGARIRGWGLGRRPSLPPPRLHPHAPGPRARGDDGGTTFHFVTETCGDGGRLLRRHDEQA
jgi:hypothetical protein